MKCMSKETKMPNKKITADHFFLRPKKQAVRKNVGY